MHFNRAIKVANALIGGVRQVKTRGMEIGTNPDYVQSFAAAIDWWREAGVDSTFMDEPRSWFPAAEEPEAPTRIRSKAPAKAVEPPEPEAVAPAVLPDDLDGFRTWWMTSPELVAGRIRGRIAPRGEMSPKLMIVSPMPEETDDERLLAGPEGHLLDGFLASAGLGEGEVYHASAMPCHSPGADWSPAGTRILSDALRRHIALVRPERLLVLGFVVLPLLEHSSPQAPAVSSVFNHEGVTVPMLAVRRIPAMASQPRWKSTLWQAWLNWTA